MNENMKILLFSDFVRFYLNNINYNLLYSNNLKSNAIELFKKGRKIFIKKSNRGKFTLYCNGKVTDECIRKGKNSSNPKIRKRAIFAANSRKWSHS